jgi:predicted O-linked N-acetylglucosamine transferase (SPINDLY family)
LGLDIAVDLKGYTTDSRPGIFSYQVAPLQVNYLGYPGTMGAPYIDYIIADPVLIPPPYQIFYSEKVVYLPGSYQVNDSSRKISDKVMQRSDAGLPEDAFVFCCFNNPYKITPEVFDIWMSLLKKVEGSVIWLLQANSSVVQNLGKEAEKRGIDAGRLIFANRLPLPEHLARQRLADLFLDTFNYNAHTTASDALWAGLPVVTKLGEGFASRVGGSLLNAVGLPELITSSAQVYADVALMLAEDPQKLNILKARLGDNLKKSTLFNSALFARHLEMAYVQMYRRLKEGLEPEHIYISAD